MSENDTLRIVIAEDVSVVDVIVREKKVQTQYVEDKPILSPFTVVVTDPCLRWARTYARGGLLSYSVTHSNGQLS